ncbi:MAG: KilA-N domain-containing protein [Bacteroidota bacterium]
MVKSDRPIQRPDDVIRSWLRNSAIIRFLEVGERNNNIDFKPDQMDGIKIELSDDREAVRTNRFIEETGAIGIESTASRYGGTYCHVDIAFEFTSWLSPEFKYFIIKDNQRVKALESPH